MAKAPSAAALALAEALERAYRLALDLDEAGAGGTTATALRDAVDDARACAVIAFRPACADPAGAAPPGRPRPGP